MGKHTIGTVKVPTAGLSVEVYTLRQRPKMVQLQVTRYGLPFSVELSMAEADELSMALAMAYSEALSAAPAGLVR